jgi:hypothetical protein
MNSEMSSQNSIITYRAVILATSGIGPHNRQTALGVEQSLGLARREKVHARVLKPRSIIGG